MQAVSWCEPGSPPYAFGTLHLECSGCGPAALDKAESETALFASSLEGTAATFEAGICSSELGSFFIAKGRLETVILIILMSPSPGPNHSEK